MVKLANKIIKVRYCVKKGLESFICDGQTILIENTLEIWKDTGSWWDGEPEKTFYRVQSKQGSLYELYVDNSAKTWFLYRIYD